MNNFLYFHNYCILKTMKNPTCFDPWGIIIMDLYTKCLCIRLFFLLWRCDPTRVMASLFLTFLDHTQRRTAVGRTPLDEWSARRRDLYLTTHDTHNRQTSMPPVGFEPHDLNWRAAADRSLRPRGHWNRHIQSVPGGRDKTSGECSLC